VVDGDEMGGMDVGVGFSSSGSKYAVSKNGQGKGGGGDMEKMVLSRCRVSLLVFRFLTTIGRI